MYEGGWKHSRSDGIVMDSGNYLTSKDIFFFQLALISSTLDFFFTNFKQVNLGTRLAKLYYDHNVHVNHRHAADIFTRLNNKDDNYRVGDGQSHKSSLRVSPATL